MSICSAPDVRFAVLRANPTSISPERDQEVGIGQRLHNPILSYFAAGWHMLLQLVITTTMCLTNTAEFLQVLVNIPEFGGNDFGR